MKKNILVILAVMLVFHAGAQQIFDIQRFGAKGNGQTNDAEAIQEAINACSKAGGGTVLVPAPFTFLTGPFDLKSNVALVIETGAVLKASPDEKLYTKSAFGNNPGEGTLWIGGENAENITISGGGRIDGNGIAFMGQELGDSYELKPFHIQDPRPHVMTLV